ncbi:hypothetical protein MKW98_005277 [Papaver atlanticum]|uniref:Uncharacterized protein n=1 Tax=Papaver atlanticum TaxID=357466 RepID=A0AAD4X3V7_9MAGN|nr:hypothetical protein MKW98_005277 [Papaver atlanticum]
MDKACEEILSPSRPKWRKVAYGGMQPGYEDNYTDESFLEGSTIRPPGELTNPTLTSNISLNASIVASVLIASRLPSRLQVFAIVLFSLQVFLFAPLITYCIKKYSFVLHLLFSSGLMVVTLGFVFTLHPLLFVLLLSLLVFVTVICPYWLIKIQEYKFEINGPWDEAKLCFDITE